MKRPIGFILTGVILLVIAFFAAPATYEVLAFRKCEPIRFKSANPFIIEGSTYGDSTQYVLQIKPGAYVAYLLISEMNPTFKGLRLPAIIRSDEPKMYTTGFLSDGNLTVQTRSSYTLLPEEALEIRRYPVRFPIDARNVSISQAGRRSVNGPRTHLESLGLEHAIDISGEMGASVVAAKDGVVVFSESRSPDGSCTQPEQRSRPDNQIVVLHDDGTEAVYGHLRQGSIRVDVGQKVRVGEQIAEMGSSGWTPGTHLHFHVGGLTITGYRTLPLVFECSDGRSVNPVAGGEVCTQ